MARQGRNTETLKHLRTAELICADTAAAAATTLNAAAAVGATSLTVASITGIAVGQTLAIGNGERKHLVKVHASTAPSGNTVTLDAEFPVAYALDIGEAVVKQQTITLGAVHADGVSVAWDGEPTDIMAENQAFLMAQKTGFAEVTVEFGLVGGTPENFSAILGFLLSRISGSGTAASPREFYVDFTDPASIIGEQQGLAWRLTGVRQDGTVIQYECWAVELDPTAFALEIGRAVNVKLPVRLKATGGVMKRFALN